MGIVDYLQLDGRQHVPRSELIRDFEAAGQPFEAIIIRNIVQLRSLGYIRVEILNGEPHYTTH